jgi:serine/threonine-protein kinase
VPEGWVFVYRATDTKLRREVAIKVLPDDFAEDPERLTRFEREAHVLASLNHPGIASIHGLEESDGVRFLVMELVPGETLADRLTRGPLPVDEALQRARQIAEALEDAHEHGIIHRDLKPANIKLTHDEKVKVLDFGLAKALSDDKTGQDLSQSPTATIEGTRPGVILGTAPYMSPEQARGKPIDKRTDIFAFGCVLYEMLTGRRAFGGETVSDTIAAILEREPDTSRLPMSISAKARDLLLRCLAKNPRRRLQHIGDARVEIEEILAQESDVSGTYTSTPCRALRANRRERLLTWSLVAALAAAAFLLWRSRPEPFERTTVHFTIPPPGGAVLQSKGWPSVAVSPNGKHLVYVVEQNEQSMLYVRSLERSAPEPMAGTQGATTPFFSPDGQWVGFFADKSLKKVSLAGGPVFTLCDAGAPRGATWFGDTIVFSPGWDTGLAHVSAEGGVPEVLTVLDSVAGEVSHRWPEISRDGRNVLFTARAADDRSFDEARIAALDLQTGQRRIVIEGGSYPRYVSTGHILFTKGGSLLAVPFDPREARTTGSPIPLQEPVVAYPANGVAHVAVSKNGVLVSLADSPVAPKNSMLWLNREAEVHVVSERTIPQISPLYSELDLSHDGTRVAISGLVQENLQVLIYELSSGTHTRLTFEGANSGPVWSPDDQRIAFASTKEGARNIYWKPFDGSRNAERLTASEHPQWPTSWSPNGEVLSYVETSPLTGYDIWLLAMGTEKKAQPFLQTRHDEHLAQFSPNGHWLAYVSDESGQLEVYVTAFPGPQGRWQISTDGGTQPRWGPDGQELFYLLDGKLMSVLVETDPVFRTGKPELLFQASVIEDFDVAPGGDGFILVVKERMQSKHARVHVALNWFEELRRLAAEVH